MMLRRFEKRMQSNLLPDILPGRAGYRVHSLCDARGATAAILLVEPTEPRETGIPTSQVERCRKESDVHAET